MFRKIRSIFLSIHMAVHKFPTKGPFMPRRSRRHNRAVLRVTPTVCITMLAFGLRLPRLFELVRLP